MLLLTATAWAEPFYRADIDFNGKVDLNDLVIMKGEFLGPPIIHPTGPAPVPKTGQTESLADHDDGYYKKGVEWPNPRFIDNGDGTVTDKLTGLLWLKKWT